MPPSFEAPHLMLVITAFTGPLQVKRRRRILRIGSLRTPACEIVRQAVDPGRRMIVGLADAWVRLNEDDDLRCAILTGAVVVVAAKWAGAKWPVDDDDDDPAPA